MNGEQAQTPMAELRVEVRTSDDGITYAGLQIPGGQWLVLLTVAAQAYTASAEVQAAVIALAQAVVRQLLAEAAPGAHIGSTRVVQLGSPTHGRKH
jgi:hypothetical protein